MTKDCLTLKKKKYLLTEKKKNPTNNCAGEVSVNSSDVKIISFANY